MQALRNASFVNLPTPLGIQTLIMVGPYLTNSGRFLDARIFRHNHSPFAYGWSSSQSEVPGEAFEAIADHWQACIAARLALRRSISFSRVCSGWTQVLMDAISPASQATEKRSCKTSSSSVDDDSRNLAVTHPGLSAPQQHDRVVRPSV